MPDSISIGELQFVVSKLNDKGLVHSQLNAMKVWGWIDLLNGSGAVVFKNMKFPPQMLPFSCPDDKLDVVLWIKDIIPDELKTAYEELVLIDLGGIVLSMYPDPKLLTYK